MAFIEEVKQHKVAFGLLGVAAFVLFILLLRGGGSKQAADPVSQILGYNEQQNELNAQVSLQQQQIGAQQDAVDQQANAQNVATQAAAGAQNEQTDAALIANLYDTQSGAQVSTAQIGAEESVENTSTNAQLAALENTNSTQLSALNSQYNSQDYQAQLTAQLYGQGLTDQTGLQEDQITAQEQALQDQYGENTTILNEVGEAGLNHGTSSLENSLAAIIAEVEGEGSTASSFANANATGAAANASETNSFYSFLSSLGKSSGSLLNGLFG